MKRKVLALILCLVMSTVCLTACGDDEEAYESGSSYSSETSDNTAADDNVSSEASGIRFVDGFYANNGQGSDFMIAFYENAPGDVAYVNDGTNEAFAQYTVENAQTASGTEFLLVTVGNLQMGYVENGDDLYLVDISSGDIYVAGRLTEAQADEIYKALQ